MAKVTVIVGDINDNTPEFDKPSMHLNISEGEKAGKVFLVGTVRDMDSGANSVDRFFLYF